MSPARQALLRLLRAGERARSREAAESVSLPMTPAKCPEYCDLRTLGDTEQFEAEIALAARDGGIAIEPERFSAAIIPGCSACVWSVSNILPRTSALHCSAHRSNRPP